MFSLVIWTLRRLEVADRFCFTPVVAWSEDIPYAVTGCSNPFLLYFRPVSPISVESAVKSADVAFANKWDRAYGSTVNGYEFNQDEIVRLARIYKKYMKLQPDLQERIDSEVRGLLKKSPGKVLGVHVRGVDWRKTKVYEHPIAFTEEDYLQAAKDMMKELEYEKIFLATDSEETIRKFQAEFGDRLITTQAVRAPAGSNALAIFDERNDGYQMGFEVLRDAYALAACDALLCGLSNVSYGAQIIKSSLGCLYEKVKTLDNGTAKTGPSFRAAEKKERKELRKRAENLDRSGG